MLRTIILVCVCGTLFDGQPARPRLPSPDYDRSASDPEWLAYAAQFHGHLGPWATAGTRLGMAGLRAVKANGHFDVDVVCEGPFVKPPKSCLLDGLQVATGATLGKRNLHWVQQPNDTIVIRVRNTRTGECVEVRPTKRLLEILHTLKPHIKAEHVDKPDEHDDHDHEVEALARVIAVLPDHDILTITRKDHTQSPKE